MELNSLGSHKGRKRECGKKAARTSGTQRRPSKPGLKGHFWKRKELISPWSGLIIGLKRKAKPQRRPSGNHTPTGWKSPKSHTVKTRDSRDLARDRGKVGGSKVFKMETRPGQGAKKKGVQKPLGKKPLFPGGKKKNPSVNKETGS